MSAIIAFHKDLLVVDHAKLDGMSQGELIELAKETNGKTLKSAKQTLLHAGQTGFVLLALKQKSEHGSFMMSVKHSIGISHRTASNYMGIALNYASVSSLRGVSDAIRYIREASTKAKAQNGNVSNLPNLRTPARLVDVHVEAEIVPPTLDIDDEDDIETLVVDESKTAPKSKTDSIRLPNDEAIDAHLFAKIVRMNPEWGTMRPDFLKETKDKYLTRSAEESDRKIQNILFELWVIDPAIRAEILNGIINLK